MLMADLKGKSHLALLIKISNFIKLTYDTIMAITEKDIGNDDYNLFDMYTAYT